MSKIKNFINNHSNFEIYWSGDIFHIIPNITLIYHSYHKGISFSFEWMKLTIWMEINIKPYKD